MVGYSDFLNSWKQVLANNNDGQGTDDGFGGTTPFWGAIDPNDELRRRFSIPGSISNQQIQQYFQQNGLPDPKNSGGFGKQLMDFAGPGSPMAWMASMIFGGPVAGSIAAANGSGATDSLGGKNTAQLASLASMAYGGSGDSFGSTPSDAVAGSEYGAVNGNAPGLDWNNTYAANNTGTMTDAGGEPGMWDWLDNLGGDTFSTNPSFTDLGGNIDPNTGFALDGTEVAPGGAMDQFGSVASPNGLGTQGNIGDAFGGPGILDYLKQYGQKGMDIYKTIKGLTGRGGGAGGGTTGGGILDGILKNPGQAAFNASPLLLAGYMANKQSGDLNGVLDSINGDAYSKSVLNPYDRDTGIGRTNLLEDQNLRGVSGSSFGQGALDNYDYTRSLGRSDMASKAQIAAAGLRGNLINQRNTNTNLLLGAGLGASGSLFKPQSDPFNLKQLLGFP